MSKFHLNDKGEAGQCKATQGGCPFGGEAQHYSSTEKARTAYEASMAAEQIPATVKKTFATSEQKVESVSLPSREDFDPDLHDGFEYDEVFFDEEEVRRDAFVDSTSGESHDPMDKDDFTEMTQRVLTRRRAEWENMARTEPAKSFEKNVPIRLIPAYSTVQIDARTGYGSRSDAPKLARNVGQPVFDEEEDRWVGRYADADNQWRRAEPYTTFDTAHVPPGGKLNPSWEEENEIAQRLSAVRAGYAKPEKK